MELNRKHSAVANRLGSRMLGNLEVSTLGLGCVSMSDYYGRSDRSESIATLERAIDLGCCFFDTADIYGHGENETLIGKTIRRRREEVVLSTKFGVEALPSEKQTGFALVNGAPQEVRSKCLASLKRLGTDYIDLYCLHRVDPQIPVEDTVEAMGLLVTEGLVANIAICDASPAIVRRAHAIHPVTAVQNEWSLWSRDVERMLLPTLRELGIGFVAYCPLGRGFLTGSLGGPSDFEKEDRRRISGRFQVGVFEKNERLLHPLRRMAHAKGCTMGQLALSWLLHQGEDVVPIPGTKRVNRLVENLGAVDVQLEPEDLKYLRERFPPGIAVGDR